MRRMHVVKSFVFFFYIYRCMATKAAHKAYNSGAHLERFVEPDDVWVSEYCHDACLAVQVRSLILILRLARVNDLYSHLQRHSHTSHHMHRHTYT